MLSKDDFFLRFLGLSLVFMLIINLMMIFDGPESRPGDFGRKVNFSFSQPVAEGDKVETVLVADYEEEGSLTAVDLTLLYDPADWAVLTVEPGSLWNEPVVLKREIDHQQGRVRFVFLTLEPETAVGEIAKLSFLKLDPGAKQLILGFADKEINKTAMATMGGNFTGELRGLNYRLK